MKLVFYFVALCVIVLAWAKSSPDYDDVDVMSQEGDGIEGEETGNGSSEDDNAIKSGAVKEGDDDVISQERDGIDGEETGDGSSEYESAIESGAVKEDDDDDGVDNDDVNSQEKDGIDGEETGNENSEYDNAIESGDVVEGMEEEIATNDTLGRHIVATRDIKKGEIILRDNPIVIGPKVVSYPICLGCHKLLTISPEQKDFYRCSKCTWPLCSSDCENSKQHVDECNIIASKKFICGIQYDKNEIKKQAAYCAIVPLRVMILKSKDPNLYNEIMKLEHHLDKRINTPLYGVLKANLITFFKTCLSLSEFDENEILQIAATLDTNSFEIRQESQQSKLRGLYRLASLFSHDCVPNTRHIFDSKNQILFIATVDIPKGSIVTVSYTQALKCTLMRREHLLSSKCFECRCKRCEDPSEFDTFIGAILCSKCKVGKIISTDPLNNAAPWKCQLCPHQIPAKQFSWGCSALQKEIESLNKSSPKDFEEFIVRYQDILHEKNTFVIQVKYALTQLYGNVKGFFLNELSDAAVQRKVELCHELLEIADLFDPGWSHFRGTLLLDLQEIMAVQAKREYNRGLITKEATQEKLLESMKLLQEAVEILKLEPGMETMLQERVSTLASEIEMD